VRVLLEQNSVIRVRFASGQRHPATSQEGFGFLPVADAGDAADVVSHRFSHSFLIERIGKQRQPRQRQPRWRGLIPPSDGLRKSKSKRRIDP